MTRDSEPLEGSAPGLSLVRLSTILALLALLTSRVTLVLHELVGHALVARLAGSDIAEVHLFLFGGGWVRYTDPAAFSPAESHLVALGGVLLELLLASAMFLAVAVRARRAPGATPWRISLTLYASIIALHGLFYVVAGTHYGFGDGRGLHASLGAVRAPAVLLGSLGLCVMTFGVVRARIDEWSVWLGEGSRSRQLTRLLLAVVVAAACHGGLAAAERRLVGSTPHDRIMASAQDRAVEADVQRFLQARRAAGVEPTAEALAELRASSEAEHRSFPLYWALLPALAVAAALGAMRSGRAAANAVAPPSWRFVLVLAGMLAALLVAIAVLNWL